MGNNESSGNNYLCCKAQNNEKYDDIYLLTYGAYDKDKLDNDFFHDMIRESKDSIQDMVRFKASIAKFPTTELKGKLNTRSTLSTAYIISTNDISNKDESALSDKSSIKQYYINCVLMIQKKFRKWKNRKARLFTIHNLVDETNFSSIMIQAFEHTKAPELNHTSTKSSLALLLLQAPHSRRGSQHKRNNSSLCKLSSSTDLPHRLATLTFGDSQPSGTFYKNVSTINKLTLTQSEIDNSYENVFGIKLFRNDSKLIGHFNNDSFEAEGLGHYDSDVHSFQGKLYNDAIRSISEKSNLRLRLWDKC